jgi:transcription elongation factor SPT6
VVLGTKYFEALIELETDVMDPSGNPGEQNVGKQLIVDGKYEYSDLDELIVNHVNAMARKVEELIAHEKYKAGSEAELRE